MRALGHYRCMMNLKYLAIFLVLVLVSIRTQAQSKYKVVCSMNIIADMVRSLAPSQIEVMSLVEIGGDPHTHEATPKDARRIYDANLIFINGLHCESWMEELILNSGTKAPMIATTKYIEPIYKDGMGMSPDPHAWMDPLSSVQYIKVIKESLIAKFPEYSDEIITKHNAYKAELFALHDMISIWMDSIPKEDRVLITSHDAFSYFGRRYDVKVLPLLGTSTEADIESSSVKKLINYIKENRVKAIFSETTINPKVLQQIAKATGASLGLPLYADSIGDEGSPGNSYINMMKYNARSIFDGLLGKIEPNDFYPQSFGDEENGSFAFIMLGVIFIGLFFGVIIKLQ